MALTNSLVKKFGHNTMRQVMKYMSTFNHESQVYAQGSADGATTGTKLMTLNGVTKVCAADAAYDISAELGYAAWATSTAYTIDGQTNSEVVVDGRHFACILAHTSSAADKPLSGANWQTYWKELDVWAELAAGWVMANADKWWILVCVNTEGKCMAFKASDGVAGTRPCVIPAYDPERWCPIALLYVQAAGAVTIGTTDITAITTVYQLQNPTLPDFDSMDKN